MADARRTSWPAGHVIRMTRDAVDGEPISVATCECGGFESRAPATVDGYAHQDEACEAHWRAVEQPEVAHG